MRETTHIEADELDAVWAEGPADRTSGHRTSVKASPPVASKATLADSRARVNRATRTTAIRAHVRIRENLATEPAGAVEPMPSPPLATTASSGGAAAAYQSSSDIPLAFKATIPDSIATINSKLMLEIGKFIMLKVKTINELISSIAGMPNILTTHLSLIATMTAEAAHKYRLIAEEAGLALAKLSKFPSYHLINETESSSSLDIKHVAELVKKATDAAYKTSAIAEEILYVTEPTDSTKPSKVYQALSTGLLAANQAYTLINLVSKNIYAIIHCPKPIFIPSITADLFPILGSAYALIDSKAQLSKLKIFENYTVLFAIHITLSRAAAISTRHIETSPSSRRMFAKILAAGAVDDATIANLLHTVLSYLPTMASTADIASRLNTEVAKTKALATNTLCISAHTLATVTTLLGSDDTDEIIKTANAARVMAADAATDLTRIVRVGISETNICSLSTIIYSRLLEMLTQIAAYQDIKNVQVRLDAAALATTDIAKICLIAREKVIIFAKRIIELEQTEAPMIATETKYATTTIATNIPNPKLITARDIFFNACRDVVDAREKLDTSIADEAEAHPFPLAHRSIPDIHRSAAKEFDDACLKVINYQTRISPASTAAAMLIAAHEVIKATKEANTLSCTTVGTAASSVHTKLALAYTNAQATKSSWEAATPGLSFLSMISMAGGGGAAARVATAADTPVDIDTGIRLLATAASMPAARGSAVRGGITVMIPEDLNLGRTISQESRESTAEGRF